MIQSIKATIIKEIRENLRMAGLIFVISAALLGVGLSMQRQAGMSILGDDFLKICMGIYPALGLALGVLQIFHDSRKGRWQFVLHRPMSPSLMLMCKIAAGVALYLSATIIPLGIAVLWAAVPGHFPGPFSWDMAEPCVAYLLWGLIWYAAGMVIAMRKARWFGGRLIALGGAIAGSWACYAFSWTLTEFILIALAATVAQFIALMGVFRSGGDTFRASVWSKPFISVSLLLGWIVVIGVSSALGDAAIRQLYPDRSNNTPYRQYRWMPDGQIQIWTYQAHSNGIAKAQDLHGADLPLPPSEYWAMNTPPVASIYSIDRIRGERLAYPAFHEGFLQPQNHLISAGNQWFYVINRRLFEQYDPQTRRLLISVGPNGSALPGGHTAPFSARAQYTRAVGLENVIFTPDAVYVIDLSRPSTTKIFTAAANDPVLDVATSDDERYYSKVNHEDRNLPDRRPFTVVFTAESFHILQDKQPPVVVPIDLPTDQTTVEIARTPNGNFKFAYGLDWSVGLSTLDVYNYDATGKLIDQIHLPKTQNTQADPPSLEEVGALTLSPPAFFDAILLRRIERLSTPWHAFALLIGSSIFYIPIAFGLLRFRHASSRQMWFWLPITAAMGLPGILLLLSMLDRPPAVRCQSCGNRRLVTEDHCHNCDAVADPPAMEGIEIFESGLPVVVA